MMTGREQKVLTLVIEGKTNKEIAKIIGASDFTVREHVSSILHKIGVRSRVELLAAEIKKLESQKKNL